MALIALIGVTAVWGVTFVQVKDAVELYPLLAFLAVRFVLATAALAVPAGARVVTLGRRGIVAAAALGLLLAIGYVLQTAGLERTTVSGTGFITGMYVVLTPVIALALFRTRIGTGAWLGVALSTAGLALLSGVHSGSATGDLLVLAASAVYSLQIVLMERFAPRYDALAFTLVEMAAVAAGLLVVAAAHGDLGVPHGATVWAALLVTGVFASASGSSCRHGRRRRPPRPVRRSPSPWSPSSPRSSATRSQGTASGSRGGEGARRSWAASSSPSRRRPARSSAL